jgi:hypothetical protein
MLFPFVHYAKVAASASRLECGLSAALVNLLLEQTTTTDSFNLLAATAAVVTGRLMLLFLQLLCSMCGRVCNIVILL